MRISTVLVAAACLSGLAMFGAVEAASPRLPKYKPISCKIVTSGPRAGIRTSDEGYRYRMAVGLDDTRLTPIAGGCSATGNGDQFGLAVSAAKGNEWECVYTSPNNTANPVITVTAVGCVVAPPK